MLPPMLWPPSIPISDAILGGTEATAASTSAAERQTLNVSGYLKGGGQSEWECKVIRRKRRVLLLQLPHAADLFHSDRDRLRVVE